MSNTRYCDQQPHHSVPVGIVSAGIASASHNKYNYYYY